MNVLRTKTLEYISWALSSSGEEAPIPSWPELLEVSEDERLSPVLYIAMMKRNISIPPQFREGFARQYLYNWRRNASTFKELSKLLPALGGPVILLKGASLLPAVYKNLGLRGMVDVDILVREENVAQINKTLIRLGYRPFPGLRSSTPTNYLNSLMYEKKELRLLLHLHWHLVNAVIPNYVYREKINIDKLWEEAVPVKVGQADALCLAPHHQLLHLSEHALKHSYHPLQVVLDIHQTLNYRGEEFDWERLVNEAEEFGLKGPLFYGLWLSKDFFHTGVPQWVIESLRPQRPGLAERVFYDMLKQGKRQEETVWLFYLSNTSGWRKKTVFLFRTVFPPQDVLRVMEGIDVDNGALYRSYWLLFLRRLQGALRLFSGRNR